MASLAIAAAIVAAGSATAIAAPGTWNGASGATWNTSSTNWLGLSGTPWDATNGPTNTARFNTAGITTATVSGLVTTNGLTFSPSTSGSLTLSGGTIALGGGTSAQIINTTPGTTAASTLTIASTLTSTTNFFIGGYGTTILSASNSLSGTVTIGSGAGSVTDPAVRISNSDALKGAAQVVVVTGGAGSTGQMLSLSDGVTITGIPLAFSGASSTRGGLVVSTGNTATWDGNITNSSTGLSVVWVGGLMTIGSGTATTLDSYVWVRGSGTGTINSSIIGTANFTKNDTGTWIINSASNTYSGTTRIFNGTLQFASIADASSPSAIGTGGTIEIGQNSAGASGVGTLRFTGAAGGSSNRTISITTGASGGGATIDSAVVGQTLTLSGSVTTSTSNLGTLTLTGSGNGVLSGNITPTANKNLTLTKAGSGTWTLSGSNAYSGTTSVNAGVLALGSTNALPTTGTITFGGGTLQYGVNNIPDISGRILSSGSAISIDTNGQSVTFASALASSNAGGLTKRGAGTLILSASNAYLGTTTVSAGILEIGGGSTTGSLSSSTAITGSAGGTLAFNRSDNYGGAFGNAIGGGLGILVRGGTLTLSATNTFTGATAINAGILSIPTADALQGTSGVTINGGAGLTYTGGAATLAKNVTLTAGSGTGTIRNTGGGLLTLSGNLSKDNSVLRLTGGAFNVTGTISGATPNASDLLVDGTSTVTLSAVNSYDGPTFVNQASTLIVGINNAIPNNSTVTLGNATSTGTLDLGTFTNQIGGLVFSGSGGTVRMAANQTASPQLSTSAALSLGSNASLDLTGMQTSAGNYRLISSTGLSGTFGSVTGLNSNYVLRYGTVNANEISAQRKAEFGTVAATPAAVSIITGGSTAFSYTVVNATPTNGSTLSFTSANGTNVAGASNGTAIAGGTSASISGLVFTGTSVGLNQTGSFTLADPDAIGSPANGSVSVNVLNHSLASFASTDTATKTLNFGSYDAGSWSGGDGGNGTLAYSVFNIASLGFSNAETAGLNLYDWAFASGDDVFSVGFSSFANLAAGGSNNFFATVASPGGLAEGSYTGTYTLKFRDQQDLSGAANTRDLTLTMNVVVVPEPGTIALAAIGIAAAAWARRRSHKK